MAGVRMSGGRGVHKKTVHEMMFYRRFTRSLACVYGSTGPVTE